VHELPYEGRSVCALELRRRSRIGGAAAPAFDYNESMKMKASQGCQMYIFSDQVSQFGYILEGFGMENVATL
jgi:hypothetical protein